MSHSVHITITPMCSLINQLMTLSGSLSSIPNVYHWCPLFRLAIVQILPRENKSDSCFTEERFSPDCLYSVTCYNVTCYISIGER